MGNQRSWGTGLSQNQTGLGPVLWSPSPTCLSAPVVALGLRLTTGKINRQIPAPGGRGEAG